MNIWMQAALAFLVVLTVGIFGIWAFQRWGIYKFDMTISSPAEIGLPRGSSVTFTSEDGTAITAWIVQPVGDRPVVLSFQGGHTGTPASAARMIPLIERGYGLAMLQYRGMGDGAGRPSELNFAMDARALYDQLDSLFGTAIPPDRRAVHGFSLGSSVGSRLAATRSVGAVVLEGSFPEVCRYFERRYLELPVCRFMWAERNEVASFVRQINVPILIVHGENDASVPADWARELADAANDPKRLIVVPDAGHADLDAHGLFDLMDGFLTEALP